MEKELPVANYARVTQELTLIANLSHVFLVKVFLEIIIWRFNVYYKEKNGFNKIITNKFIQPHLMKKL